jgi:signal peptide peptidase SppA
MSVMMRDTTSGLWAVHEDHVGEIQRNYATLAAITAGGRDDLRLKAEAYFQAQIDNPSVEIVKAQIDDPRVQLVGSIAVVSICGTIFPKGTIYAYYFGGAVISVIRAQTRKALADDDVKGILLRVDSPGGMVDGVTEFAAELHKARAIKPIFGIADTMAISSGFWLLAAGASEIVASPSAQVGGVGVFVEHVSIAKALEIEGIEVTVVASSEEKVEDHRTKALSEAAHAHKKELVDQVAAMFVADVARGRGVTPKAVRDSYGNGRYFLAKAAQSMGLVDKVATFDETVQRLVGGGRRGGARAEGVAVEPPDEPPAPLAAAAAPPVPPPAEPAGEEDPLAWIKATYDHHAADIDRHAGLDR